MSQILNYFRSLFPVGNNSERKRRRAEALEEAPIAIKYRRVSNIFPKQYQRALNEDEVDYFEAVKQSKSRYNEIIGQHFMDQKRKPFFDDEEFSDEDNVSSFRAPAPPERKREQPKSSAFNFASTSGLTKTAFSFSKFNGQKKCDGIKNPVPKPRSKTKMPALLPLQQSEMGNGYTSNGFGNDISSQQTRGRKSIIDFNSKNRGFGETAFKYNAMVMDKNHNLEQKNHYDALLKSLITAYPNPGSSSASHKYSPGLKLLSSESKKPVATIDLSKEDDVEENIQQTNFSSSYQRRKSDYVPMRKSADIINLSYDDNDLYLAREPLLSSTLLNRKDETPKSPDKSEKSLSSSISEIPPVNSLRERQSILACMQDNQILSIVNRYAESQKQLQRRIDNEKKNVQQLSQCRAEKEKEHQYKIRDTISALEHFIILDEEEEVVDEFPKLSEKQMAHARNSLQGGQRYEVIVSKFNMNITRNDLHTLVGDNWLNDEVINFYMELLRERSELNECLPKVHTMNTFFIPKLLQTGQSGVRRWTRKVDIFSFDIIPVPVHVGGVHWCMSIINFREKTIKYYDSMGHPNQRVLDALEDYLKDESMDKKKQTFDFDGWTKENVRDCPRQMNSSDCGVFSCMFAEFISRDSKISFNQQHMSYFRTKMVFEIATGKLLLGY